VTCQKISEASRYGWLFVLFWLVLPAWLFWTLSHIWVLVAPQWSSVQLVGLDCLVPSVVWSSELIGNWLSNCCIIILWFRLFSLSCMNITSKYRIINPTLAIDDYLFNSGWFYLHDLGICFLSDALLWSKALVSDCFEGKHWWFDVMIMVCHIWELE